MKDEIISLKDYCTLYILQKSKIKHLEKALYPFSFNIFLPKALEPLLPFRIGTSSTWNMTGPQSVRTSLHLNLEHWVGPAGPCKQLGSNRRPHFRENLVYLYRLCGGGGETHKKGRGVRYVLAKLCGNHCRPNICTAIPRALIPTDRAHHILNILKAF